MRIWLLNINEITDDTLVKTRLPQRYRRALQYRSESDRLRCIGAGLLLVRELGIRDESEILYTPDGKPFLAEGPAFSLSHSGSYCVLAVGEGKIGIDIEHMEAAHLPSLEMIASDAELAWVREGDRIQRLYTLWTRKEALAKAIGTGNFRDPREIDLKKYNERFFSTEFRESYCISAYEENEESETAHFLIST